jgi:hypothetical protein
MGPGQPQLAGTPIDLDDGVLKHLGAMLGLPKISYGTLRITAKRF